MNDRETRRYDMFGRAKTFGQTNTADFAAGSELYASAHLDTVLMIWGLRFLCRH